MYKMDFYTSNASNKNNYEMIRTTGKDCTTCELKAMQVNYNLYGTYKIPGGSNSGSALKYSNVKYNSKGVYYIKKEIRDVFYKKNAFIDSIIEYEKNLQFNVL